MTTGSAMELAAGRSVSKDNCFAFYNDWSTHWANEVEFGFETPEQALNGYRLQLTAFRKEYGGARELPDVPFFQFGMGLRTKYLFKRGQLLNALSSRDYPLTWEIRASQADYAGIRMVDPVFCEQQTAAPHTWHAAEIFLYLLDTP